MGAGKSTALHMFAELGAITLSADGLVHDLYERPEIARQVNDHFRGGVLEDRGGVDRSRLAASVRGRPDELGWLEDLIHPLVAEEIERRIEAAPVGSVLVCEVPLLFESGYEALCDLVVTVEADPEARRARSVHSFDLDQFSELDGLQASSERRVRESDLAYLNDQGLAALESFVEKAYGKAQSLLGVEA
jgi:dephospho-CoA kinase